MWGKQYICKHFVLQTSTWNTTNTVYHMFIHRDQSFCIYFALVWYFRSNLPCASPVCGNMFYSSKRSFFSVQQLFCCCKLHSLLCSFQEAVLWNEVRSAVALLGPETNALRVVQERGAVDQRVGWWDCGEIWDDAHLGHHVWTECNRWQQQPMQLLTNNSL